MVADRYAMDGRRSVRGWRTEIDGAEERRLRARARVSGRAAAVAVPALPVDEEAQ
jgi:hypothetical protein